MLFFFYLFNVKHCVVAGVKHVYLMFSLMIHVDVKVTSTVVKNYNLHQQAM